MYMDGPEFKEYVLEGRRYSADITGACESEIFDEERQCWRRMTDAEHVESFAAWLRSKSQDKTP
jgi:hypothetical protein